jgi:hypothetical protein
VFLVNSRYPLVYATPSGSVRKELHPNEALLLPKLRRYFAEFLNHSSPDRLGILYPPTCVGLGYGHRVNSLLGFSRQHGISDFVWIDSASRLGILTNSHRSSLHAYPGTTIARDHLPSCVPLQLPATSAEGSSFDSPLVTDFGLGADTVVLEYQPVVHRLRLSASP